MEELNAGIYVNTDIKLLKPQNEFVCWIDIMGSQATMTTNINRAANYLFRFHTCLIKSINSTTDSVKIPVNYYPVMDGIYITSVSLPSLRTVINKIFKDLAVIFSEESIQEHRFIIRGAIAYGPVIHGNDISDKCCPDLNADTSGYKEKLLLGMPISQCYSGERNAPPFGIYMHDSAIAFGNFSGRFYTWWNRSDKKLIEQLKTDITSYFDSCSKRIHSLGMESDKIDKYKSLSGEYFTLN